MSTTPGEIVRAERLRRGWSLREAGDAGGTSHSQWDRIERNEARKPMEMRMSVCRAFDWPIDWVENPPPPPEVIQRDDQVLSAIKELGWKLLRTTEALMTEIAALREEVDRLQSEARSTPPARRRGS